MTLLQPALAQRLRPVPLASLLRQPVAGLGLALLGIVLLMLLVDGPVARAIATWPVSVRDIAGAVTAPLRGGYFIVLSLGATLVALARFLAAREDKGRWGILVDTGFVTASTLVALLCATVLKVLIGRARPELIGLYGPHAFFPLSTSTLLTSFPSGETSMTIAFFAACALVARRRVGLSLAIALLLPALVVAASRPIVGAHYVSDVVAATLLAAAVAIWLDGIRDRYQTGSSGPPTAS